MVVSPDENDSSQSVVELFIDGESVATRTADKTQLIGDGVELQVWAGNEWRGSYGTGTTYLIKDLIYNGNIRQVFKGCTTACFEQQTCEDVARGLSKEDRCADSGELVEGMCGCPDGHVLDEGVCVSESSCGCINEAAEYAAVGSKQIVGPEECTCTEGGEYECVALGCPCDKFDEECIDFVCEAPRNFDAAEEGYVGKFIPPQEFEISFEWLCEESLTTTKYVQGPHIIDIETPRSVLSENPSDMLPGIEDEGKQKKKTNRNGSARSGRISPYWFAYIANQSGSAVLVHTNGGSSWVTHWLGAGRGPQCIPGFNEMKLTQVFDSETNTYIMKTFLNNIEIGNLDIPFDQYFQVESELAVYIGSPWSHRLYAGMLGQIRNFYMRDLSKQCFIGETPEISGGRVALKDIDLEKSFRVSMELDCNETISLSTYGTVWDIRDKDIPRSEGPSSNPAILDDEESRFTSPYDGKAYTLINRYPSSTFIILFDGPGATHTDHGNFDMRYSPLTYNWGVQVMRYWLNDCPGDGWTRFEFEHKFDVDTGLWTDMWTIDGVPAVSSSYSPESWTQGNNFKLGLSNGPETEAEVNVRNFCYQGLNYV
ncbi:unnamed protein product [Oikopleura dioica]|uniref:VWFD domain-containing protein n=1 Tax=Oikopleura dioica TaxID=34765 RepID=E4XL73_OIKDI|nr:unnamed protein product [Oikopleura dioica]